MTLLRMISAARFIALALALATVTAAAPVALLAITHDGKPAVQRPVQVKDRPLRVWNGDLKSGSLLLKPAAPVKIPASGVVYLEVAYLDQGYGKLTVNLVGKAGETIQPDRFLGLARTDSGAIVTARMRMTGLQAVGAGELSVRIGIEESGAVPLSVERVTLQAVPFDDPNFRYVISDPWLGPYTGVTVKPRDNSTLKGKAMTGYQGWFRTPNDPDGGGWVHWGNIGEGAFTTDMWPDVSQYPAPFLEKAADVKLRSGRQAYLFSSAWPAVVDTHFRWMREHDIDGAFLQRFVTDDFNSVRGRPEWVLANVRAAANREGRIWAIEYDVSGYPDAKLLETLKTDWKWFVDTFDVLNDPNYAREGGKPVVFIWGLPFPNRGFSPETANAVVDFFKNDPKYGGNYVIGGIPGNWRTMDPAWQEHFKKYECLLAWMSQAFSEDRADFKKLGISYYAHVMPGFSWANLKHHPSGNSTLEYTPRDGGRFYWNLLTKAVRSGADRMFVGMFDEYDEATAIMPMSNDPPPTPVRPGVGATFYKGPVALEQGRFVRLPSAEIALGSAVPGSNALTNDFFVRMGGQIVFPVAGTYRFSIEGAAGDDTELILNGEKLISVKNLNGVACAGTPVAVAAGDVLPYRLDYRHGTAPGRLRLLWEISGKSPQPVPPEALQDAWGRFITNEGKPADYWLKLTQAGKEMMTGKRKPDSPMP